MIIQNNMTINIRTPEEWFAFCEIGDQEGIRWKMLDRRSLKDRSIWLEGVYIDKNYKALTSPYNYKKNDNVKIVEAADLFRNHIISRRIKNGSSNSTK